MKPILIALLCLFSIQLTAQKNSFILKKVVYTKKTNVVYHYQNGEDLFLAHYINMGKYCDIKITKNKKPYFSLTRDKTGTPVYTITSSSKPIPFNNKTYKVLPQKIKIFLAYQEMDQQEFQPQFNGGGDVSPPNGIPNAVGPDIDLGFDGSSDACTQTADCSCGSTTVTVSCACGGVISCYERTTTVCDSDDAGRDVNCREVTGCAGRCD